MHGGGHTGGLVAFKQGEFGNPNEFEGALGNEPPAFGDFPAQVAQRFRYDLGRIGAEYGKVTLLELQLLLDCTFNIPSNKLCDR